MATGTPRLPYEATPAPTRSTMPQPTNRPTELVKPMALPRHSEGANRGRFYGCSETTVNRSSLTGDQKTRRFFSEEQNNS
jgi:hypothetical protein